MADLNAILSALARFTPQPQHLANGVCTEREDLRSSDNAINSKEEQNLERLSQIIAEDLRDTESHAPLQTQSTASHRPVIDPSTITTWQDGLRCLTKIAAQNAQLAVSVRRMIDEQKKAEKRWYADRQTLRHSRANRERDYDKARALLASLNSQSIQPDICLPDMARELADYDRKIYVAQRRMDETMGLELKALGVPFFGTSRDLVVEDHRKGELQDLSSARPKWSPIVTEEQFLELRRRMVGHLEDLYRD